jgi:1,2-dihydroxy-3-keto-5-methylthiopentene dioxygenase
MRRWAIPYTRWPICDGAALLHPDDLLAACDDKLKPYMASQGYQTADVVQLNANTPNLPDIRAKFLQEHTHTEDEVRLFIHGHGDFWYHMDDSPEGVFAVRAEAGDLLAVPEGTRHWFDAGLNPQVTVIRMFTDPEGWVAHYTGNAIADAFTWVEP